MEYQIKRVRSRSIKIRVEPGGMVVVTAPNFTPKFIIDRFVKTNETWIERRRQKITLTKTAFPVFLWEDKLVSYLGKLLNISIHPRGEDLPVGRQGALHLGGEAITISPVTGLEADAKKILISFLKREGEREITERTKQWAQRMETNFRGIRFRQQKSRWGSCTSDNRLSFNWRLIHFKPEVIDYVVIHELAHTIHHDHSDSFWQKVAEFDPGYKQKVKFLHRQVLELI